MKIAIEAQRLFRPKKHGLDVVAYELLRRLPAAGDVNDYHVLVKNDEDHCLENTNGRTVHYIKNAPYPVWEQVSLPSYCKKLRPDVLHCTANTAPVKITVPLIITIHDVLYLETSYLKAGGSWYQRLGNTYRSLIVPAASKNAAQIITVSNFQKDTIAATLHIDPAKIEVVHNGADERFFVQHPPAAINEVLNSYGLKPGYIFFLGNTEPRKNTPGVLHAYNILKQHISDAPKLLIKGLTKDYITKMLKDNNLSHLMPSIELAPYFSYNDLPFIYQGASMLWFPSFSEGFGLPIVEAMAGGVPVITSSTSCMPEIAGDAACLINPAQPETIALAAAELLENASLRNTIVAKGLLRAANFTWGNAVKKLLDCYAKALK